VNDRGGEGWVRGEQEGGERLRDLLGDHNCGRVEVAVGYTRHNGRVHNTQPIHTALEG